MALPGSPDEGGVMLLGVPVGVPARRLTNIKSKLC